MPTHNERCAAARSRGFTLIELMIALVIGMLVLGGMLSFFADSNRAYAELKKTIEHTGNGSMAMSILAQDINHAGYYGEFYSLPAAGAALPDPCLMTPAALYSALAFPVRQRHRMEYRAARRWHTQPADRLRDRQPACGTGSRDEPIRRRRS